jgi:hypothetical protein
VREKIDSLAGESRGGKPIPDRIKAAHRRLQRKNCGSDLAALIESIFGTRRESKQGLQYPLDSNAKLEKGVQLLSEMQRGSMSALRSARLQPREPEFSVDDVRPFGRFGAGFFTSHPIGLVVAAALVSTAWRIPAARWFTIYSLPCGVVIGLGLWLYHRRTEFRSPPSLTHGSH